MYVSDDRFILKTCGTTSLLDTIEPTVELAKKYCGYDKVLVLMSDLDDSTMSVFSYQVSSSGREATKLSGIGELLPPGTIIDDYLFEPCGYSMNAILPGELDIYFTVHITPESEFSYVSFETNISKAMYYEMVCKLLKCFNPKKFLLTVFANQAANEAFMNGTAGNGGDAFIQNGGEGKVMDKAVEIWDMELDGYMRTDEQFLKLPDQTLTYCHFQKC